MVSKLPLIIIPYLSPERETLHQHPQDYLFMCVAVQQSLSLSLPPQDLPQVRVLALITPISDLLSFCHLSGVALNVPPLWILMTHWTGKWVTHLGKAVGRRRGEENGGRVGERDWYRVLQSYIF